MSQTEMRSSVRPLTTPGSTVPTSAFSAQYAGGLDMNVGDNIENGVPIRPPASAHLLINSLDRYKDPFDSLTGQSPQANDFLITRQQALLYGYFTRLAVTQVQFEYNLPTFISGKNNKLLLVNNTTAVTSEIAIPTGFYTPNELAAELQILIRASAAGNPAFTVVFDGGLGGRGLVFATNNASVIYFCAPETSAIPLTSPANCYYRAYRACGCIPIPNAATPGPWLGATLEGTTLHLIYTDFIDIVSDRLTKFQRVKDADTIVTANKSNVVARIYTTPPGQRVEETGDGALGSNPFTICVDYNTPKHIKWSSDEAVYQLDFRVFDEYGELLPWDIYYNWDFQLTMLASET